MYCEKYCEKCGKELIIKELNTFDKKTGKKSTKMVCPSGICWHTGLTGHQDIQDPSFFEFLIGKDGECKRCGAKFYAP